MFVRALSEVQLQGLMGARAGPLKVYLTWDWRWIGALQIVNGMGDRQRSWEARGLPWRWWVSVKMDERLRPCISDDEYYEEDEDEGGWGDASDDDEDEGW